MGGGYRCAPWCYPIWPSPLAPLTTLRLGGPARRLVDAESADEVVEALREPALVIGGGSNLVIADAGWPGTVVRISSRGRRVERRPDGSVLLTVEAGEEWDDVVAATVADGLGGLECLSGIPGRTGAVPVQNVGAYGVEIADALVDVDLLDGRRACAGSRPPTSGWPTARACSRAVPTRSCCGCGSRCPATRRSAPDPLRRARQGARCGAGGAGARRRRARGRARVAARQGHGARPGRPRHLERGLLLHQPRAGGGPAGRARRWPVGPTGSRCRRPG